MNEKAHENEQYDSAVMQAQTKPTQKGPETIGVVLFRALSKTRTAQRVKHVVPWGAKRPGNANKTPVTPVMRIRKRLIVALVMFICAVVLTLLSPYLPVWKWK